MATRVRNLQQGYSRIVEDLNDAIAELSNEIKKEFSVELAQRLREATRVYIDRPRPETVRAIKPALRGQFGVRIQGIALEWLELIIEGYTENDVFIPVLKNVKLDQYGNEPRGQLRRLLFDSDTFYLPTARKGLQAGIYRRFGNNSLRKLYNRVATDTRPGFFPYEKIVNDNVAEILSTTVEEIFDRRLDQIKNEVFVTQVDLTV